MDEQGIQSAITYYSKDYPAGIPLEILESKSKETSERFVVLLDCDWKDSPWEGPAGELLAAIVEKALLVDKSEVLVFSPSNCPDLSNIQAKLLVCFGEGVYNIDCLDNQQYLQTHSLKAMLDDKSKKLEFWNKLKPYV